MEVTKAQIDHAKEIGRVHSMAWKQAYADVFPDEYIKADTPENIILYVKTRRWLVSLR